MIDAIPWLMLPSSYFSKVVIWYQCFFADISTSIHIKDYWLWQSHDWCDPVIDAHIVIFFGSKLRSWHYGHGWLDIKRRMFSTIGRLRCSQSPHQTRCMTYDQLEYNSKDFTCSAFWFVDTLQWDQPVLHESQ
jgi:hypothetical protein